LIEPPEDEEPDDDELDDPVDDEDEELDDEELEDEEELDESLELEDENLVGAAGLSPHPASNEPAASVAPPDKSSRNWRRSGAFVASAICLL
jgi:hypothetical protein